MYQTKINASFEMNLIPIKTKLTCLSIGTNVNSTVSFSCMKTTTWWTERNLNPSLTGNRGINIDYVEHTAGRDENESRQLSNELGLTHIPYYFML